MGLHSAFQDDQRLYLAMDYAAGGDLVTLMDRYEDGVPEAAARVYAAEMIAALDALHSVSFSP